eukprot:15478878-Alexandrium_andersonii.AAC.1
MGRPSPAVGDLAVLNVALEHLAGLGVDLLDHKGVAQVGQAVQVLPGGLQAAVGLDEVAVDGLDPEVGEGGVGALRRQLAEVDGELADGALLVR